MIQCDGQGQPSALLPEWWLPAIQSYLPQVNSPDAGRYAAQLLWQRGIHQLQQLHGFLDPKQYQPTSAFALPEMQLAVERLQQAIATTEKVVIWGDFDADGITATAVLWEGLRQFLPGLTYFIPNRLTESHGLSLSGIEKLAAEGCSLIVTCDTGSSNPTEIELAQQLGIDVIITDHHTLPADRPPVWAIVNPRSLPSDHPLATLSGVAVAYKLIEAIYQVMPSSAQSRQPLTHLLDLVAIGLIADLVNLTGDCRYLAQIGIQQLQKNQDPIDPPRPGIAKLLELCRRSGDRPTDISFGLGPRINAISRIQGEARFCVELLTSSDRDRCQQLALETELANARRKGLQREVVQQVKQKLTQIDLSTTEVIVLADSQWPVGILGLVAGQIAQEYNRPTILLSTEENSSEVSETNLLDAKSAAAHRISSNLSLERPSEPSNLALHSLEASNLQKSELNSSKFDFFPAEAATSKVALARGSARSIRQIDLYDLLQKQAVLLYRFGGHPFAAGLSLPVENIPLFTEAINQQVRSIAANSHSSSWNQSNLEADLTVTVAELGQGLFQELKLLEPCGMGNPVPKLQIKDCWFAKPWHRKIQDLSGRKLEYLKTEFLLCDQTCPNGFAGVWWGHYKDELPIGRCHVLVELDFNSYEDARRKKRYEVRLLSVQTESVTVLDSASWDSILDWRVIDAHPTKTIATAVIEAAATEVAANEKSATEKSVTKAFRPEESVTEKSVLPIVTCPRSWAEIRAWAQQAKKRHQTLALAYPAPNLIAPIELWQQFVGIAKYLSRTGKTVSWQQLQDKLQIGDRALQAGLASLQSIGFEVKTIQSDLSFWQSGSLAQEPIDHRESIEVFVALVQEEQFMQQYFYHVPIPILQAGLSTDSSASGWCA